MLLFIFFHVSELADDSFLAFQPFENGALALVDGNSCIFTRMVHADHFLDAIGKRLFARHGSDLRAGGTTMNGTGGGKEACT